MWKSVYEIILISKKIRSYLKIKILRRKKMKKLLIILMVVAMASFLFVGCIPIIPDPDDPVDPDGPGLYFIGIEVDPKKMDLIVEGSDTIDSVNAIYEFRVYGTDIPLEDCLFLTSDSTVATVVKKVGGYRDRTIPTYVPTTVTVTAIKVGTADILVEYEGKFATLKVTVTAPKSMEIIANMPLFELDKQARFTLEIKANNDVGKNVLVYFTLPVEATVEFYGVIEVVGTPTLDWHTLQAGDVIFGYPTSGFALKDDTVFFKATFDKVGTYKMLVEVWTVSETAPHDKIDPLCLEIITAVVAP